MHARSISCICAVSRLSIAAAVPLPALLCFCSKLAFHNWFSFLGSRWQCTCKSPATRSMSSQAAATASSITPDSILAEGPYAWSVIHDAITTKRTIAAGQDKPVKLPLVVTVPMAASPGSAAPAGPFPVCVLLNGFQVGLSWCGLKKNSSKNMISLPCLM